MGNRRRSSSGGPACFINSFRRCPLNRRMVAVIAAGLILGSLAVGQAQQEKKVQAAALQPASELANALAQRMSNDLCPRSIEQLRRAA